MALAESTLPTLPTEPREEMATAATAASAAAVDASATSSSATLPPLKDRPAAPDLEEPSTKPWAETATAVHSAATTTSDSAAAVDASAASSSAANERPLNRMESAAAEIASALVIQDTERSTPRDALEYLGQSMAFAAACSVFPCYAAWCSGLAFPRGGHQGKS